MTVYYKTKLLNKIVHGINDMALCAEVGRPFTPPKTPEDFRSYMNVHITSKFHFDIGIFRDISSKESVISGASEYAAYCLCAGKHREGKHIYVQFV